MGGDGGGDNGGCCLLMLLYKTKCDFDEWVGMVVVMMVGVVC
jgi:hypothetical protein